VSPITLDAIVGHGGVVRRLRSALGRDQLAHGLLFAGPRGVGKRTVARALAGHFLGDTDDVRHRLAAGTLADYHVVNRRLIRNHDKTGKSKAITFNVDVVREEVVRPAHRASAEGRGKVFVVEEAETMNAQAQNALLKTLEEPYGRTLVILVTDSPARLLPTIRSRSQTFAFGELARDETLGVLRGLGVEGRDAEAAHAVAGGAPGRCLAFLEDGIVALHDQLAGLMDDGQPLAEFLGHAADAAAEAALKRDPLGSRDAFTRDGLGLFLGLAARRLARSLSDDPRPATCDHIEAFHRCERYLAANVNKDLALRQLDLALTTPA